MGDNAIIGIRSSAVDNAALTVGGAKATYLSLLGNRSMQGILKMGRFAIKNIKPFVEDDSSQASSDAQKNDVINFGYFHTERGELKRLINEVGYDALNRKDPDPMEDDIDMANHSIINLKDPQPSDASHAASVNFVNTCINGSNQIIDSIIDEKIQESEERSIEAVQLENVFEKVMVDDLFILDDDDIHKVAVVNKDFHKVNQQTYQFKIDYDSNIGYYSTRLGVNVVYLPRGYYTIVFEMYFSNKIDPDKITIKASSGTLSVSKINNKKSVDHTRSVINFYKAVIYPSDDELDIDIALKNKAGESYEVDTQIFVVVYGVAGTQNNVSVKLWDKFYYYDNTSLKFELPVDMNQKDITGVNKITTDNLDVNSQIDMKGNKIHVIGVGDGTSNNDAINKIQLDVKVATVNNKIIQIRNDINTILNSLTKLKYYYFTDQLKHNNADTVKFPAINSYPFSADNNSEFLKITLDGHYQIIYTDFFIHDAQFIIHDTNGNDLFVINLDGHKSWTPITINIVIPHSNYCRQWF